MARRSGLSDLLTEFARTLGTDFPIQRILDHLVERIVELLPVTGAGVTLISPGQPPHYVAASDAGALSLERLQSTLGRGPCMTAYETGEAVTVPNLFADKRHSEFDEAAAAAGVRAVFAFPLRHNDDRLGALDLFRDTPGPLDADDMVDAQTLADVVAAYVLNAQYRRDSVRTVEVLRHNTLHDPLTGLANRVLLEQRIEHASLRARRSHADAAVLFVDLDNFKTVNDTHGHAVGDSLLIAVAKRLAALLRPGDTLARLSGDEFVILCEDLHGMSDVEVLAARVEGAFDTSFPLVTADGHQVDALVTASIGMAYAGRAEDIGDSLVRDADAAMYQTKRKGGAGHQVLDLREAKRVAARQQLQRDLHRAFLRDELDLAYQPIVHPGDGRMTGVEALLRWTHPTHGPIPALTMVDVAEQNSLIVDVGTWVLHRACAQRMQWRQRWPGMPLDLAVNVSTTQIMGAGFLETVAHVLAETGMEASALTLEITESILIDDSARALAVLADLKTLGVRLALDDFGTGYSSLSYLRRFPVDIVKIDQGFVSDIGLLPNGGSILRAVTELVHVLGLSVTAEGVETPQQREEVVAIGCEWAQGYLYAHPLPPAGIDLRIQTLPLAERGNAAFPDSGAQQLA